MHKAGSLVAAIFILCLGLAAGHSKDPDAVDVALVLAVDCSYSVTEDEFGLQLQGIADALRSPDVKRLIRSGADGGIGVVLLEWSGHDTQDVAIPWTRLGSDESIENYADHLLRLHRLESGYTSISGAIGAGLAQLSRVSFRAERRVIDISTDGINNDGVQPDIMRDLAARAGVTVNGLTITNDVAYLDLYFQHHVITGPRSFVVKADDYAAYHEAMKRKLLREIEEPVS